jgi:hypothetical protein
MHARSYVACSLLAFSLSACGGDSSAPSGTPDAQKIRLNDAGFALDDAGHALNDAGQPLNDAGIPIPNPDASCESLGQTSCPDGCRDLTTDPQNCGKCDNACIPNSICASSTGSPKCECPTDKPVACTSGCSNFSDLDNCGKCDNKCLSGALCERQIDATYKCACPTDKPATCASGCSNFTDTSNCGRCDNACVAGASCALQIDGSRACECPADKPAACASGCTDFSDNLNCGGCNKVCGPGSACKLQVSGSYACDCADAAESLCKDGCHNLANDKLNCGACGNDCLGDATCFMKQCICPTADHIYCPGLGCVPLGVNHCGACNDRCPTGATCDRNAGAASGWECNCPVGQTDLCSGPGGRQICVNRQVDNDYCGSSCDDCLDGWETCNGGTCECSTATQQCGFGNTSPQGCLDILSDPNDCGTDCNSADGANCNNDQYCSAGQCVCRPELTECTFTCTSTQTDPLNCGACSTGLAPTICPGDKRLCDAGVCKDACSQGRVNRDSNGASCAPDTCVDLSSDPRHCGRCDRNCPEDEVCVDGKCENYRPTGDCLSCGDCTACEEQFGGGSACCAYGSDPICVDARFCPSLSL